MLLAVRLRGAHCVIQVRDNGPGIAPDEQAAVFQEFVQLHNPQRDRSQGLGLGLATVQRLARLLDHPVGVRSCLGHGATFHIQLPRCEVAPPAAPGVPPPHGASTPASPGLEGCRILLVEDDALVRDGYARLFVGAWALALMVYVLVNGGMISGLLPVVGVPMPLISYGGTSAVSLLAGFGLVMAVRAHRPVHGG